MLRWPARADCLIHHGRTAIGSWPRAGEISDSLSPVPHKSGPQVSVFRQGTEQSNIPRILFGSFPSSSAMWHGAKIQILRNRFAISGPYLATAQVNNHVHSHRNRAVSLLSTVRGRRVRRSSLAVVVVRAPVRVRIMVAAIPATRISPASDTRNDRNTYLLE